MLWKAFWILHPEQVFQSSFCKAQRMSFQTFTAVLVYRKARMQQSEQRLRTTLMSCFFSSMMQENYGLLAGVQPVQPHAYGFQSLPTWSELARALQEFQSRACATVDRRINIRFNINIGIQVLFFCWMQKDKLVAVLIAGQNPTNFQVYIFTRQYQLSEFGFFQKGGVKDAFKFVARESVLAVDKGTRNSIAHEEFACHIQATSQRLVGYAFCTKTYPRRVAFAFLNQSLNAFRKEVGEKWKSLESDDNISVPEVKRLFQKYQDPTKVDKLSEAIKKVDETNIVLHENIRELLRRQGDLDQLIDKSKDLQDASKMFFKNAKKMNSSCCSLV